MKSARALVFCLVVGVAGCGGGSAEGPAVPGVDGPGSTNDPAPADGSGGLGANVGSGAAADAGPDSLDVVADAPGASTHVDGGSTSDSLSADSPPPPACRSPAQTCSAQAPCCSDSICVVIGAGQSVCAATCTAGTQCNSGCCAPLSNDPAKVCSPPSACAAPPAPTTCGRTILRGTDGQFLGLATSNKFATDGVCNMFSQYGSQYSTTSIFNKFGTYGSEFSTFSAYNRFTVTPPYLACEDSGKKLQQVTKNTILVNGIDPDALCAALAAAGL
jgi:hypothetical protein